MKIEYIAFFCSCICAAGFGIGHQGSYARQLFYKGHIVASRYHTFVVDINYILAHHLTGAYVAQGREYLAYKINKIS